MDLAALAAFPNLAAMGADVASLARVLKLHRRLVELDPTGTLVRPRPRESAATWRPCGRQVRIKHPVEPQCAISG